MLSGFSLVNFGNLILLAPNTLTRARPLSFLQVVAEDVLNGHTGGRLPLSPVDFSLL
jgi:hypothetical protein